MPEERIKKEEKKENKKKKVSEAKTKLVKQLVEIINKNKTTMLASIKGLPSSQFQEIRKKLRDRVKIKVVKKSIILRVIDACQKGKLMNLKKYVKEDSAVLFSSMDVFELAGILADNKSPAKAKIKQLAPEDIEIEAGPTDLVPGPVISELGSLGIKIAVEGGKITIKENKIIVKKGEAVTEAALGLMAKFDIKPFKVGFEPIAAYDSELDELYTEIKIDKEGTLNTVKELFSKALGFATNIGYICKDTIKLLLGKASAEEKALSALIKEPKAGEKAESKEKAEKVEEKEEESDEKNEEKTKEREEEKAEEKTEEKAEEKKPVENKLKGEKEK